MSERSKLLPPDGQPDGTTYILCNTSSEDDVLWTFTKGRWIPAGDRGSNGFTPYMMAKAGWMFPPTML